jgi:hypothetical protein
MQAMKICFIDLTKNLSKLAFPLAENRLPEYGKVGKSGSNGLLKDFVTQKVFLGNLNSTHLLGEF